jgi:TonB family protein
MLRWLRWTIGIAVLFGGASAVVAVQGQETDPVRVGGDIKAPTKIKDMQPQYPMEAMRAGVQGIVRVEITVGISGHVEAARVIRSVPLLDQAALDTVKQWEFTPPLVNGVPRPVIVTAEVSFALGGGNRALRGNLDASLLPDADVRRQPFLIAPGRVGLLQVGMTVDKLLQLIPPAQTSLIDMRFEGHFTPAIAVRLDAFSPQPSLIAAYRQLLAGGVEEWRVAAIEIMDPRFRTADGLGVGSTIAEIRAMHPNMEPTLGRAGPLVSMHDRAMWFWLDPTAVRGSRVPDTATVIRISVRGGPFSLPPAPSAR